MSMLYHLHKIDQYTFLCRSSHNDTSGELDLINQFPDLPLPFLYYILYSQFHKDLHIQRKFHDSHGNYFRLLYSAKDCTL